ncbi:hypothetical protein BH23GEM3_BH23GEM3_03460 [soil metagenome]
MLSDSCSRVKPAARVAPGHLLQADPERNPIASAYWAARVLLAGLDYTQNVDALARRIGCSRNFIARCSRRLIDNGVWQGGQTICDWEGERQLNASFWNDVAVAEGKLCRRVGEDGRLEWAAMGEWTKRYDYVKAEAEPDGLGADYIVLEPYNPEVEAPLASADHESDTDSEPAPRPMAPAPKKSVERSSRPTQPPVSRVQPAPRPRQPLPEIFPDAQWLM